MCCALVNCLFSSSVHLLIGLFIILVFIAFFGGVGFKIGFLCVALEPVLALALVDQVGLKLTVSASGVLGLKAHATTAQPVFRSLK